MDTSVVLSIIDIGRDEHENFPGWNFEDDEDDELLDKISLE